MNRRSVRKRRVRVGPRGEVCTDFKGASVRVAWGRSGLGVRPVARTPRGRVPARGAALRRAGALATSRPACFRSDWPCLTYRDSNFCN
jgi:hypothetical protein